MKCLHTAAAFMCRETIVYIVNSINYLYAPLYVAGPRICGPLLDENMFCGLRAIFIRFI